MRISSRTPKRILTLGGNFFHTRLRELGHEVLPLASAEFFREPGTARRRFREAAADFHPDFILQFDDSTPAIHLGLEDIDVPRFWYAVDTHLHLAWQRHYAPLFHRVFCAQRNRVEPLAVHGADVRALPLCFPGEPSFLPWDQRNREVTFVGTVDPARNPERSALFAALERKGARVEIAQGDYAPVYSRSKAVVNQSVNDDLNFRCFEAMGCGALLITDSISHSLDSLGEPGGDFLVYEHGDADALEAHIRWVARHPQEAEAMASRGHRRILDAHLARHRVEELLDACESVPARNRHVTLDHLAFAHARVAELDIGSGLQAFFAGEARRLGLACLAEFPSSPWARLALAQAALDADGGEALGYLEGIDPAPAGEEFRRPYHGLRTLLLARSGRRNEARRALGEGLAEFPGDPDLMRMYQVL